MNLKKPVATILSATLAVSSMALPAIADDTQSAIADDMQSASTNITASVPGGYTIVVPESIALTGSAGSGEKTGVIPVTLKGDIAENQIVTVTATAPVMARAGSADVAGTIDTPKTEWSRDEISANGGEGTTSEYTVKATLTPGDWNGSVTFSCTLSNGPELIPVGGVYTVKSTGEKLIGDGVSVYFPTTAQNLDTYVEGDYTYIYKSALYTDGWNVARNDTTKTSYGEIRSYVGSLPVEGMFWTFLECNQMTKAPEIPSTIKDMTGTFLSCRALVEAPKIPDSVTIMRGTFSGCTSLTKAPEIPGSVTDIRETFYDCSSLTEAPVIPNSVTAMDSTFFNCTSLTGTLICNANPTLYDYALGATKITAIEGSCSDETKAALLATR